MSETRLFRQDATRDRFIAAVEDILGRDVRAFSSATDPSAGVVYEIFTFASDGGEPPRGAVDGATPPPTGA